jgi:hypothetical protein
MKRLTAMPSLGRESLPGLRGRGRARRPVRGAGLTVALLSLTLGCFTSATPRVLEVTSRTRLQEVDAVDTRLFVDDTASRIKYVPQDLSIEDQREEFYVRWGGPNITLVKFEYRQVAKPNTVFEQTYAPHDATSNIFAVRGEDFRSGGSVSAWRVSLWNGDQLLAEKKSFLW